MLKRFCRSHVLFVVVCLITLELPITSVCQLEVGAEESTVKDYLERGKRYIEMELYDQAINCGALGGKILGAGGGGFLLLYMKNYARKKFFSKNKKIINIPFSFTMDKSEIIFDKIER